MPDSTACHVLQANTEPTLARRTIPYVEGKVDGRTRGLDAMTHSMTQVCERKDGRQQDPAPATRLVFCLPFGIRDKWRARETTRQACLLLSHCRYQDRGLAGWLLPSSAREAARSPGIDLVSDRLQ